MPRRKISNTQAVCILLLWFLLVYMLLRYSPTVDFMTVFTIIASGIANPEGFPLRRSSEP